MVNWRKEIEQSYDKYVRYLLKYHGFRNIRSVRRLNYPYDYLAELDGLKCFVELKVRSKEAKSQFFCFRTSQINALQKLSESAQVYVLLINKYGYKLVGLQELLLKKDGIYGFNYHIARNKAVRAYYFTPLGWREKRPSRKAVEKVALTITPDLKEAITKAAKEQFGDRKGATAMFVEFKLRELLKLPKLERDSKDNSRLIYKSKRKE